MATTEAPIVHGSISCSTITAGQWSVDSDHLIPNTDEQFDIGSSDKRVRKLYVSEVVGAAFVSEAVGGTAFKAIYNSAQWTGGSVYTLQNAWEVSDLLSYALNNAGTITDSNGVTTTNRERGCFNVPANNGVFGYDTTTGMFTAPYDGIYFFSASILWHTASFNAGYTTVMITKPGDPIPNNPHHSTAYLISQSGGNEAFDSNYTQTCDGLVKLMAGEEVGLYVRGQHLGGAPKIDLSFTSFCGYMVQRI